MSNEMSMSRRGFAGLLAVAGCGAAIGCASAGEGDMAFAEESSPASDGAEHTGTQYGFLVDSKYCANCEKCIEACRAHNTLSEGDPDRRWIVTARDPDSGDWHHASVGCMHCENPSCMEVCPAGAISKNEVGAVIVDHDRCIGCKYCYQACPFGVPAYSSIGMVKCDYCHSSGIEPGEKPYCAQACRFRALTFGPLDELRERAGGKETPIEASTGPSYIII